jgi:hypothetical protein
MSDCMDWREEAERLRNIAGQLQDDNDRLRHEALCAEEKSDVSYQHIRELNAQVDALQDCVRRRLAA